MLLVVDSHTTQQAKPNKVHMWENILGWTLDIEQRYDGSTRHFKTLRCVPEAHVRLNHILVTNTILGALAKTRFPEYATVPVTKLMEQFKLHPDWGWAHFYDVQKIQAMVTNSSNWSFNHTAHTDGVAISFQYKKTVIVSPAARISQILTKKFNCFQVRPRPDHVPHPLIGAGQCEERDARLLTPQDNLCAIDPGINNLMTAVSITKPHSTKPLGISNAQWQEESSIRFMAKKRGHYRYQGETRESSDHRKFLGPIAEALKDVPYRTSMIADKYKEYLRATLAVMDQQWAYWRKVRVRHDTFKGWKLRQKFMAKAVQRVINRFGEDVKVLYGNGGAQGQFMRLRCHKRKPPVVAFRKELAKRLPVILVSEYRTSKLCLMCGSVLKHPNHGAIYSISYCEKQTEARRLLARDVDAARKIGARFIACQRGLPLGPWEQGAPIPVHPCTVLKDVLKEFCTDAKLLPIKDRAKPRGIDWTNPPPH